MTNSLDQNLRRFLEYIEIEKNRAQLTLRNYEFYLTRFIRWVEKQGVRSPEAITPEHVRQYRLWLNRLNDNKGELLKRNTQNYHLIALRAWFKYLAKVDVKVVAPEKIELGKQPERQVEFLEEEELERLLNAPIRQLADKFQIPNSKSQINSKSQNSNKKTYNLQPTTYNLSITNLRDKAILELLFSTGLRVSECAKLKIEDINLERDEFSIRGKGGKIRVVFLSEAAKKWLREYLNKRHDTYEFMFVAHRKIPKKETTDCPLTSRTIQRIVEHYARMAGITKHITPHTLRHTFATDLLRNGADIRSVQSLLGHASVTTTQVYTHITDEHLRDIHKSFHGKKRVIE